MLKIEQLDVKERSGRYLLKDISMEIPAGRVIGLTGKSGSGKTTLLRSILGMLHTSCHIDAGKILLDDIDLSHLSRKSHRELCGKKLGFIPQNPSIYPPNVSEQKGRAHPPALYFWFSKQKNQAKISCSFSCTRKRVAGQCS